MNKKLYWKQQIPLIGLQLLCMAALATFLFANKNSMDIITLILLVWGVILFGYLIMVYINRKKQTGKLLV